VFEKSLLRRLFELNGDEVTGEKYRLLNEELHDLFFSPNTTMMFKSRRLISGARSTNGERSGACSALVEKTERMRVNEWKTLKGNFKKWNRGHGLKRSGSE
jgi:hypothetical protein